MGHGLRVKHGKEIMKQEPEVTGSIAFMVKRVLGTMMASVEGVYCQDRWLEFDPLDPQNGRRELEN